MSDRQPGTFLDIPFGNGFTVFCLFVFSICSSEVHERISKIDKLRKRYEIITVAMTPPEGEEEHSQAYYVIKVTDVPLNPIAIWFVPIRIQAAQEREELQRKGDDFDSKIRRAEKEIR